MIAFPRGSGGTQSLGVSARLECFFFISCPTGSPGTTFRFKVPGGLTFQKCVGDCPPESPTCKCALRVTGKGDGCIDNMDWNCNFPGCCRCCGTACYTEMGKQDPE